MPQKFQMLTYTFAHYLKLFGEYLHRQSNIMRLEFLRFIMWVDLLPLVLSLDAAFVFLDRSSDLPSLTLSPIATVELNPKDCMPRKDAARSTAV